MAGFLISADIEPSNALSAWGGKVQLKRATFRTWSTLWSVCLPATLTSWSSTQTCGQDGQPPSTACLASPTSKWVAQEAEVAWCPLVAVPCTACPARTCTSPCLHARLAVPRTCTRVRISIPRTRGASRSPCHPIIQLNHPWPFRLLWVCASARNGSLHQIIRMWLMDECMENSPWSWAQSENQTELLSYRSAFSFCCNNLRAQPSFLYHVPEINFHTIWCASHLLGYLGIAINLKWQNMYSGSNAHSSRSCLSGCHWTIHVIIIIFHDIEYTSWNQCSFDAG